MKSELQLLSPGREAHLTYPGEGYGATRANRDAGKKNRIQPGRPEILSPNTGVRESHPEAEGAGGPHSSLRAPL